MSAIKKKDKVIVLAGKDKGKIGEVREIIKEKNRVIVTGINIVSKHQKPNKNNPGGIIKMEAPIHISNVKLICPKCDKPTKVRNRILESGDKVRVCKKCGEIIV